MQILLIDDDIEIFLLLKAFIGTQFKFSYCPSLLEASAFLTNHCPELIILDIELEDGNGIDFYIKNQDLFEQNNISILMLSSVTNLNKKIESFELGAVDFVNKPFEPSELLARIKSILRRKEKSLSPQIVKKDIIIDLEMNQVYIETDNLKIKLELSPTEYKLLVLFMKNEDHVFSREKLMELVWGADINITYRSIDQHMSKLRKKVLSKHYQIITKHGMGYAFCSI